MPLAAITIENFKGISSPVKVPLRPITLLFGANSAGKSTIIQAMQYAWEVLENRNPDVDRTRLGGDLMDLGGFRNLVHGHDVEREIVITLHCSGGPVVDSYLPPNGYFSPAFGNDWIDGDYLNITNYFDFEDIAVRLTIGWNSSERRAVIKTYDILVNGDLLARMGERNTGNVQLRVEVEHPILSKATISAAEEFGTVLRDIVYFFAGYDPHDEDDQDATDRLSELSSEEIEEMASLDLGIEEPADFASERWPLLKTPDTVPLPGWGRNLQLGDSIHPEVTPKGDAMEEMSSVLSQFVCGVGETVVKELRGIRYLGPLREIPERLYSIPLQVRPERWANGLAAWDLLARDVETDDRDRDFLGDFNGYLGRLLQLGYSIRREQRIRLAEDSRLMAELRLFASRYEEYDGDRFRKKVLDPIDSLKRDPALQLRDENQDVDVDPMDIGVGVSQVIPVVVGAMDDECTIFAVEQPELHIHPAVQTNLADIFIREQLEHRRKKRIFLLETHSEHLILRIMRRMRQTVEGSLPDGFPRVVPDDVAVLYVETHNSRLLVREMPLNERGELVKAWPGGFFEEGLRETLE